MVVPPQLVKSFLHGLEMKKDLKERVHITTVTEIVESTAICATMCGVGYALFIILSINAYDQSDDNDHDRLLLNDE